VKESGIREITLHSKEINVLEVSFKNAEFDKTPTLESISYNMKLTTVTFVFDGELPVGQAVLHCKFKGILNGDMNGFYKSNYSDADGNKKVMASTQFEALDARRAFLCVDEPLAKATFTVCLIVLAHHTAIRYVHMDTYIYLQI
jgi:aminopeptidase N